MPELPDVEAYRTAIRNKVFGQRLVDVRLRSVFLVRSIEPPLTALKGMRLVDLWRVGKRLAFEFAEDERRLYMILHLMISGRLQWAKRGAGLPGKRGLCAFDFEEGTLILTEASKKKRASLYVVASREAVAEHDPGGLEPLECDRSDFRARIRLRNHTLKRALTDPRLFSGIGGAYADEIMHAARLSPIVWTSRLSDDEVERLFDATQSTLSAWAQRMTDEAGDGWPTVTAFRDGMAVHGKYRAPCRVCQTPIQRIVYAETETNYCPRCQTGGKILADRSLSRLLKGDWPRTVEELESLQRKP